MTVALDQIIKIDDWRVAAIAERSTIKRGLFGVISFQCTKCPLVVLIYKEGEIHAFRPDGRQMRSHQVEQFYPGVLKEFEQRCSLLGAG